MEKERPEKGRSDQEKGGAGKKGGAGEKDENCRRQAQD
jgi:hypothetical protein